MLCIRVLGNSGQDYAKIGDKIVVTVKDAMPAGGIKKGTVSKAVIVRTTNKLRRKDGSYIRFDDNAVVLLNASDELRGHVFLGRWLVNYVIKAIQALFAWHQKYCKSIIKETSWVPKADS